MAGSIVVTSADLGGGVAKYSVAWTSDAAGAVSGNSFNVKRGRILQAKFVPGSGGTQPTDLYDVTLLDADSVDLLNGMGANRSNAASSILPALSGGGETMTQIAFFEGGAVTPVVAGAGNAKTGTLILIVA
jgi:hypothetical protein